MKLSPLDGVWLGMGKVVWQQVKQLFGANGAHEANGIIQIPSHFEFFLFFFFFLPFSFVKLVKESKEISFNKAFDAKTRVTQKKAWTTLIVYPNNHQTLCFVWGFHTHALPMWCKGTYGNSIWAKSYFISHFCLEKAMHLNLRFLFLIIYIYIYIYIYIFKFISYYQFHIFFILFVFSVLGWSEAVKFSPEAKPSQLVAAQGGPLDHKVVHFN